MREFQFPHSRCRFGIARRDVTPPVGIYHRMWGAAVHDRSEGVHRPLTATAIALRPHSGDALQVIVAVDHCLLFPREMEQLRERVCAASGVSPDDLLVVFSHTHAAGLMEERRADQPGGELIAPYLKDLATNIAAAIGEAVASVQPATITYGTGRCSLAAHRDFFDEDSRRYVCGFNPDGPTDDTVLVARVTDSDSKTIATIVNYACHPTTLAWQNRQISPDFVGAMRETVETTTGVPCVFLQGASGDLGPRVGFAGDTAIADANGRQLGYAALSVLEELPPPGTKLSYAGPVVSGATIGTWEFAPLTDAERHDGSYWRTQQFTVDLPYRSGLPKVDEIQQELELRSSDAQQARSAGNEQAAADARAMVERCRRQLTRLDGLPPGNSFPYPVTALRIGNALWLAVEGEPYNLLQRELRACFPGVPIVLMELANGSRIGYLPTAETYGTGIYQESIALLERGCLETLIERVAERLTATV
jgi:Neutral/alkaline non-lysosomal ceramidase, N-terminal